jgi:hypothetical protein
MQKTFQNQRGGGKLQALIALVVVAILIIGAIRIVPVYVRAYELRDFMRSEAKFAGVNRKPHEAVRNDVYLKAMALDLPVERNQIQSSAVPSGIRVVARFSVPVDLVVMDYNLNFEFEGDTRSAY